MYIYRILFAFYLFRSSHKLNAGIPLKGLSNTLNCSVPGRGISGAASRLAFSLLCIFNHFSTVSPMVTGQLVVIYLKGEVSLYTTPIVLLERGKARVAGPHSTPSMVCKGDARGLYDCNQFSHSLAFIFCSTFCRYTIDYTRIVKNC